MLARSGLIRSAAIIAAVALMAGMLPKVSLAATSGNEFTSTQFGFSVTWDDAEWTADAPEQGDGTESIKLSNDYSWSYFAAVQGDDVDGEACLDRMSSGWRESSDVLDFGVAPRRTQLPTSAIGGEQGLYIMSMKDGQDT